MTASQLSHSLEIGDLGSCVRQIACLHEDDDKDEEEESCIWVIWNAGIKCRNRQYSFDNKFTNLKILRWINQRHRFDWFEDHSIQILYSHDIQIKALLPKLCPRKLKAAWRKLRFKVVLYRQQMFTQFMGIVCTNSDPLTFWEQFHTCPHHFPAF